MEELVDKNALMQVFGCIMQDTLILGDTKFKLEVDDFPDLFTRSIFAAMNNLFINGVQKITVIDVDKYLSKTPNLYKEFMQGNGIQYLNDAEEMALLENFNYYYQRTKKFSALRSLRKKGIDISEFYDTSLLGKSEFKDMEKKFDEMTLSDIFNRISKRVMDIETKYNSSEVKGSIVASDGIDSLRLKLKQSPEIGYSFQNEIYNTVVRGARKGKFFLNSGSTGSGKALPNSVKIPTPQGLKRVDEIQVGDMLYDRNGEPTCVLGVFPQGVRQINRIHLEDGRIAECCDEHLWSFYASKDAEELTTMTLTEMKRYKKKHKIYLPVNEPLIDYNSPFAELIEKLLGGFGDELEYEFNIGMAKTLTEEMRKMGVVVKLIENGPKGTIVVKLEDRVRVTIIEKTCEYEEMTCFLVANDEHLFLMNDYIVTHNTRFMVGNACNLSYPYRFNTRLNKWEKTGSTQKSLVITTELEEEEIQTMVLAYLTGINEEIILNNTCTDIEEKRVDEAIEVMRHFDGLYIERLSDPSVSQIVSCIKKHNMLYKVDHVFYDYIFSSPGLLNEYRDLKVREDVALNLLSTALKDVAVEKNIFVMSGSQLNADWETKKGIRNQNLLRGSKSIADKIDIGSITLPVTKEEINMLTPYINSLGITQPTHVTDIYKVRRGRYNEVRIWSYFDLGTCRMTDLFITDAYFNPIRDFKVVKYILDNDAPDLEEEPRPRKGEDDNKKRGDIAALWNDLI